MMFQSLNIFGDNDPGRITTLPVRYFALTLYLSILVIELIFLRLGLCGPSYPLQWAIPVALFMVPFVWLEWWEQRTFKVKPPLAMAIGLIAIRLLFNETVSLLSCSGFHQFLGLAPPLLAYLYIGPRAAFITACINILLHIRWSAFTFDGTFLSTDFVDENVLVEIFIFMVGIVLILVLGRVLTQEEQNRERAERLVTELEASQKQVTELAKVSERNRIARDIHDSVGHHLTAITIQIEKAQAFRGINPAEADQALVDAKRSAKSALADVRDSVSALRDQDRRFELKNGLNQLVTDFNQVAVTLAFDGDETLFSKASLIALYRVAQEGLTNIGKHAQATTAVLNVQLTDDHGILTLKDNGVGLDTETLDVQRASKEAHFGLMGLQERLEMVGGTLTIESKKNQGTTLHVRVPTRGLDERR